MNSICVASCNPVRDSWVFDLVSWYLDEEGFVDKEKNGKIRFYVVHEGTFVFADDEQWFKDNLPDTVTNSLTGEYIPPKRFSFVQLTIFNNPILLKKNPRYLSELQNLPPHERDAQLYGNWLVRLENPDYFSRHMVRGKNGERVVPHVPIGATRVRAWDKAATEYIPKINNNDADFTACIGMAKDKYGNYYIYGDFCKENYDQHEQVYGKFRKNSAQRDQIMLEQARYDGKDTYLVIAKDAGADGKTVYQELSKKFLAEGFKVKPSLSGHSQSKWTRFEPFLCACQAGVVHIVESSFPDQRTLDKFYAELEAFNPDPVTGKWRSNRTIKDDLIDVCADAYSFLAGLRVIEVPNIHALPKPPLSNKALELGSI